VTVLCGGSVARKQNSTRTRSMSCIAAASISRKYFSREISEKQYFSREILEKKIEIQISFFYTFGILTTKMTAKMYTKLAFIEINDEILSKVGGIWNFFGKYL
jgi:hypothetical protein